MPEQTVEVVHFFIKEPAFECSNIRLAFLQPRRPALLHVKIIENLVGVTPVVGIADPGGLKLVQVQVGFHDIATLKVGSDIEASSAKFRHVGCGLDTFMPHVEANLPPLVNEPHCKGLIWHRNITVLVRKGKSFGHARLAQ